MALGKHNMTLMCLSHAWRTRHSQPRSGPKFSKVSFSSLVQVARMPPSNKSGPPCLIFSRVSSVR